MWSEDEYWLSVRVQQALVQRDEQHEAEEEAGRREEVPDVVVVVEVEDVAVSVEVPTLRCWAALAVGRVTEEHQTWQCQWLNLYHPWVYILPRNPYPA